MNLPTVVSREQWLAARTELLAREKAMTRARDVLNADRRRLPMVRIDKDYTFDGPQGAVSLRDLFGDSRQLVLQHVMFDPAWDNACDGCSAGLDELAPGLLDHLQARDTRFVAVSRAPYAKLDAFRTKRGWTFPWFSSFGSDFNYDFHVSLDAAVAPVVLNYRDATQLRAAGIGWATEGPSEQPGLSSFLRDGDAVFHTYSTFGRGTEAMGGAYAVLDLTALGRQEDWEEPKGRASSPHPADPSFQS
jgi:predicted dithiol-disulfide oxidoreductase (DUF899 family)